MTKIKTGAIVILAVAWAGLWVYSGRVAADRDRLAGEAASARAEAAGLARELKLNHQALERREAEKERLANENVQLRHQLSEVYANDPQARSWADALCPSGVLDCLRR